MAFAKEIENLNKRQKKLALHKSTNFHAIPGHGVTAMIGSTTYSLGNTRLMQKQHIHNSAVAEPYDCRRSNGIKQRERGE